MNRKNIKFIESDAFKDKVNIELFNELIWFISETSSNESKNILSDIEKRCIWFKNNNMPEIHEIGEIEYFGELLERYEEKIGSDIKNIRTIALVLGYAKELITSNMIIGTQLIDFINKIKKIATNDIYLQAALYLYDNEKYFKYREELLNKKYKNTEDILFVLSLMENLEDSFNILREQIIGLIGKNKTISAINNVKLYAWSINRLYDVIKRDRKKDNTLLKKIISIPTKQIKENDDTYKVLYENGYSKEEIAYLNYALLFYSSIPNKIRLGNSITEERIAINFCEVILNSLNEQKESIYNLLETMINEYWNFEIKCAGKESLKEAIIDEINIVNPTTFLKFYEIFNGRIYKFNILDSKWDMLAEQMKYDDYENLFDKFIEYNNFCKEDLKKCIEKYNQITKKSYIDTFYLFYYARENVFKQLVDKEIIDLIDYFRKYETKDETQKMDIEHLRNYVRGIKTRKAFLFLKYILEDRKYEIEEIDKFNFYLKELFINRRYSYYTEEKLDIDKTFLSKEEKQKLFYWLDNYMFKIYPEEYMDFTIIVLNCEYIQNIVPQEELREIYFMITKVDADIAKDSRLREKYLTKQELEEVINKDIEEKEKKKELELKRKQEEIIENFNNISKNSFKDLYNFCYEYKWNKDEWDICYPIVLKYINENLNNFKVNEDEIINLVELLRLLIKKEVITLKELREIILKYMKEELYDGVIERAC